MSKPVSIGQSHNLMAILASKVRWDELDGEVVQREMIEKPDRVVAEFMRFLKNRGQVIVASSKLVIDRTQPFDPSFVGKGWTIDEQDERSLQLTEIDLNAVLLQDMLRPEDNGSIQGEEKLKRLKKAGHVRLDAAVFKALWDNQHLIPESWKSKYVYFDGTVLRSPNGCRRVLYFYCDGSRWGWDYHWLDNNTLGNRPSAVLVPR